MKQFLSCDWGTSSFRLRLIDASSLDIVNEVSSDQGIALTHTQWLSEGEPESAREAFYKKVIAKAALELTKDGKDMPIILSGMASSSIGIRELPYQNFPFNWKASELIYKKIEPDVTLQYPVYLVSGMRVANDIMRGEETMLLGCEQAGRYGFYIFPGTHSKHVVVEDGMAIDFKTYMTGEVFNLMSKESILKNSVEAGKDVAAFEKGVVEAQHGNLLNSFFTVRANRVLGDSSLVSNYQYLSGLIIGTELKDLKAFSPSMFGLVGDGPLFESYTSAMQILKMEQVQLISATTALIKGHGKIFNAVI
ncbi:2-dehydro-3-deoxygalactonokinase [soil metagenome]